MKHPGKAIHALLEQWFHRFGRHVAAREAGTAGGDHHIDAVIGDPALHNGLNGRFIVGYDGSCGDCVKTVGTGCTQRFST